MKPKVLFIGSIGTVAETSEIQRQSYNQALKENNVNWQWDEKVYRKLLKSNGGQDRLQTLGEATGQELSQETIEKIHARKTELAGEHIKNQNIKPRPGLSRLIKQAQENNVKVAWVTTTGTENTDAILAAAGDELSAQDFDHIFHRDDASQGKPAPHIYKQALKHYNIEPNEAIAIEDSLNSALAARGANIFTVVTPGAYHDEPLENIANVVAPSLESMDWTDVTARYN